jgi:hypothetical protein
VITSVAVCPHPPLLVPVIAAGAAFETDDLRAACDVAVGRLMAAAPAQVVVLGADGPRGGLGGYAPGGVGLPDYDLPLSLTIGCWLLDRASAPAVRVPRVLVGVRPDGTPGEGWPDLNTARSANTGLLVMADGSARRSSKGPGYLDDRAESFDAAVTKALAKADADALAGLDAALAAELLAAGVGPWKALAALTGAANWTAEVLYDAAPYGVQYTVASWLPA